MLNWRRLVGKTESHECANAMHDEASYICDSCGEEIVVPIDLSAGEEQTYVEDCPVCCRPMVIHVAVDDDGEVSVWGESE
jgi:hypothetical protein